MSHSDDPSWMPSRRFYIPLLCLLALIAVSAAQGTGTYGLPTGTSPPYPLLQSFPPFWAQCPVLAPSLAALSIVANPFYPIATRLWSFSLGGSLNFIFYLCDKEAPLATSATITSSICLQSCRTFDCAVRSYGTLISDIDNGRSISIFANADRQALLMTDNLGLRLNYCYYYNCGDPIRMQTAAEIAAGSQILGTSLTRSTDGTLTFAYLESLPNQVFRIIYRPDYNSSESIVIDSWQSSSNFTESPLFLRFDTTGRAIIGYQKFENDSISFAISRYNGTEETERVAEWALTERIYEISHAPRQTASDTAYVTLASSSVYTFVYTSYIYSPETVNPSLAPTNNVTNEPSSSPAPNAATPTSPEPEVPSIPSSSPDLSNPSTLPSPASTSPSPIDNDTDPNAPSFNASLSPGYPIGMSNSTGWNSTKPVRLVSAFTSGSVARYGFQASVDYWPPYGPVYALTYYTRSGMVGIYTATCPMDGCKADPLLRLAFDLQAFKSNYSFTSFYPPAVASVFGSFRFADWRVTALAPNGVFMLAAFDLSAVTGDSSPLTTTYELANSPNSPSNYNSPSNRLGIFITASGAALIVIGGVISLVTLLILFLTRRLAGVNLQAANAEASINTASEHQSRTLGLYYKSLKE